MSAHKGWAADPRLLLAAGLLGTAIHAAVIPEHLTEWAAAGVFFVVLAAAELGIAALLLARPQPRVLLAVAAVSIGPLALWCYSRTVGIPFGPGAGVPEQVGLSDITACVLEISTLLVAVVLLRRSDGLRPLTTSVSAPQMARPCRRDRSHRHRTRRQWPRLARRRQQLGSSASDGVFSLTC